MIQYLVILGAAVNFLAALAYIRDTLWGNTKPNRITWLLWGVAPLIGTAAAITDGVTWATLPTFVSGFSPLLVFAASFFNPNAYWKLHKLDYVCGAFSVLALTLWAITREPAVAIALAIVSDALAVVPTLIKSWKYPETETGIAYAGGLFGSLTSFAAIPTWSFSQYAFPLYLAIANTALLFACYRKKIFGQSAK